LQPGWPLADIPRNILHIRRDHGYRGKELVMVDGKDELAMDQLDTVAGGTKARLVEVDTTKPVTKVPAPSGPVPIPYPNTASNEPM
jgi:hypothetical protein